MVILVAYFEKRRLKETFALKGKYLEHFNSAFPKFESDLKEVKTAVAYFAGGSQAEEAARLIQLCGWRKQDDEISLTFHDEKEIGLTSGALNGALIGLSEAKGWLNEKGWPPLVCLLTESEFQDLCSRAKTLDRMEAMMQSGDYKGMVMLFASLHKVKDNAHVWNDADILYKLGLACSKLAVTLLIKADQTKKLKTAGQYRDFCVIFLKRGAELEKDSARCATALAYRYYSNVHELTRPGERRDQDLEKQIELANEWLSRAIEIYPQSVKNNYRKGKLIIEKQAPYLLYGKRSFGAQEARLLREIREVGEEHLASAIAIYESPENVGGKTADRRDYAKALFVLGGYYLDDAYLPVLEYFCRKIAGKGSISIPAIARLNIESAIDMLQKCYDAESDKPLDDGLDIAALAAKEKEWTRSPVEKLYRLGCAYSAMIFIDLIQGHDDKVRQNADRAVKLLEGAKKVADTNQARKRNTWHISEKIAWTYIYCGQYGRAAKLIVRARAGYIVNTCAIALMLTGTGENVKKAYAALERAVNDKHNLAAGFTKVLYAFATAKTGRTFALDTKDLSAKNRALAEILGVAPEKEHPGKQK